MPSFQVPSCLLSIALRSAGRYSVSPQLCPLLSIIDGVRTKRKHGDKQARYPWRFRRYFNPIFKGQAITKKGASLLLSLGRGRDPIRVHLPKAMPPGMIAQAELGYGEIYLTVTREIPESTSCRGDPRWPMARTRSHRLVGHGLGGKDR